MLAIERKNEILGRLRNEKRVLVSELAEYYNVTEETIRRDLDKLEKEGYATKTYGGAILGNSTKTLYPVYKCSVSGCSAFDIRDGYESTPSHTMTSYSYTGSNYHAGNYHYIRYERHCVQCGHSTGYWDHYSCPGNGHCILPQSVFPVLTDK